MFSLVCFWLFWVCFGLNTFCSFAIMFAIFFSFTHVACGCVQLTRMSVVLTALKRPFCMMLYVCGIEYFPTNGVVFEACGSGGRFARSSGA